MRYNQHLAAIAGQYNAEAFRVLHDAIEDRGEHGVGVPVNVPGSLPAYDPAVWATPLQLTPTPEDFTQVETVRRRGRGRGRGTTIRIVSRVQHGQTRTAEGVAREARDARQRAGALPEDMVASPHGWSVLDNRGRHTG